MKWLVVMAVLAALLWSAGDRLSGWIDGGREVAGGLTEPIYGLSDTLEKTRARVDETNEKMGLLTGHAASVSSGGGGTAAYGAGARRELERLNQ